MSAGASHPGPPRIGVFLCGCGGGISDVVDVARLADLARARSGVALVREGPFLCGDAGQRLIREAGRQPIERDTLYRRVQRDPSEPSRWTV